MRRSFRGKWCIVTGAGSGIGRETALVLAKRGARLVLLDKNGETLLQARNEVQALGAEVQHHLVDVADRSAFETVAHDLEGVSSELALLVNNAGVLRLGGFRESTLEDYEQVLRVNLLAVVHGCQLFAPAMVSRGEGAIVNVASVSGVVGFSPLSAYSTSKFAVVGFSQALRGELSGSGVSVGVVCPGLVRTGIAASADLSEQTTRKLDELLRRRGSSPRKIAKSLVSGAETGRGLILPDPQAWALSWAQRLFPNQASSWLARVAGR